MATIYYTDGTHKLVEPANGRDFKLKELQEYIGGWIEIVPIPGNLHLIMVIDEEGKLKDLPINARATKLYSNHRDTINGPALVCRQEEIK